MLSSRFPSYFRKWPSFSHTAHRRIDIKKIFRRNYTILVEGNIGSGKSTFLNSFSSFEDIAIMAEPVHRWTNLRKNHNLLDLIYKDPHRWSMAFQSYVQLTRIQMLSENLQSPIRIQERSLYSARYIFIQNFIESKMMSESEQAICDEWFKFILGRPDMAVDLVIYLRTDPSVALQRTKIRSRQEEAGIPLDYLEALHDLHDRWLRKGHFPLPAPVMELDANKSAKDVEDDFEKNVINFPELNRLLRNGPERSVPTFG